jgi:septal ring factor EnvC (AmiA/AmiB activator)
MERVNDLFGKANQKCLEEIERLNKVIAHDEEGAMATALMITELKEDIRKLQASLEQTGAAVRAAEHRNEKLQLLIVKLKAEIYDLRTPHEDL